MQLMDNEKIGRFIATRRKALGMTQKELGERLFVSDKTVSKWERGASLPNVALLQPLAEVLEVGVSDLLNGECQLQEAKTSDAAISNALILSLQETHLHEQRHWRLLFASALIVTLLEGALLFFLTGSFQSLWPCGLLLIFAIWLCFFAKPWLPAYYDSNPIHFIQQGPFRINMVGLRFNNSNWPPLLNLFRWASLLAAVLYPLGLLAAALWAPISSVLLRTLALIMVCGFLVAVYAVGKHYE